MYTNKLEKKLSEIKELISIARKAGYVIIGQDTLKSYTKKLYAILIDKSAGDALKHSMNFLAQERQIPLFEIDRLNDLVSIEKCRVIGIKNKVLCESIERCLKGE